VTSGAARDSDGFGLVKLVIALVILNFAILALFATAGSGALAPAPADTTGCRESSTSPCGR
jgi:hypothetical protein